MHNPGTRRLFGSGGTSSSPVTASATTATTTTRMSSNNNDNPGQNHKDTAIPPSLEKALVLARTDPDAVVLSLWPSAIAAPTTSPSQIDAARAYLENRGAAIVHEQSVEVPSSAALLLVLAAYWGEDWLETNCWYGEQPLEELGLPPPRGSWPGAKWKKALCFRQPPSDPGGSMTMHVFVARADDKNRNRLWTDKYAVRASMARDTGHAGNSCMHLTDDQSGMLRTPNPSLGRGTDCNASYAYCCARLLLNPRAMERLVRFSTEDFPGDGDRSTEAFRRAFGEFCAWLGDAATPDIVVRGGEWKGP